MDAHELTRLRQKYQDAKGDDIFDPAFKQAAAVAKLYTTESAVTATQIATATTAVPTEVGSVGVWLLPVQAVPALEALERSCPEAAGGCGIASGRRDVALRPVAAQATPSTTFQMVMTASWVTENAATSLVDAYLRSVATSRAWV